MISNYSPSFMYRRKICTHEIHIGSVFQLLNALFGFFIKPICKTVNIVLASFFSTGIYNYNEFMIYSYGFITNFLIADGFYIIPSFLIRIIIFPLLFKFFIIFNFTKFVHFFIVAKIFY